MSRKTSSMIVSLGNVVGSTFAIGNNATVVDGRASADDDEQDRDGDE